MRGLTQERLADDSGLSVRGIRDLERGRSRAPRRRTASLLADALQLSGHERDDFLELAAASRTRRAPEPPAQPAVAPVVTPGELPPATNDLTGRDDELARLLAMARRAAGLPDRALPDACRSLAGHADIAGSAAVARGVDVRDHPPVAAGAGVAGPVVAVLHGLPGCGKTALAINAGHLVRPGFADGQLFADLLATTGAPLDPVVALGAFLRSLGMPADRIPATLAERTACYRTLTQARRLVVVLDDAADERQVRSLLPAGAGSLVLITARRPLAGLAAVERLQLGPLVHPAGAELLGTVIGPRADAEPEATAELAGLCGHLPLALRIAGNRLAGRPTWTVARLVRALRDPARRLGGLTAGDQDVRGAFLASYRVLPTTTAMVFRRCAALAHTDFGVAPAAVAADLSPADVTTALEDLVDAGLLCTSGERYRFHDLARLVAEERLRHDEPPRAVLAARERLVRRLFERMPRALTAVPLITGMSGTAGYAPGDDHRSDDLLNAPRTRPHGKATG